MEYILPREYSLICFSLHKITSRRKNILKMLKTAPTYAHQEIADREVYTRGEYSHPWDIWGVFPLHTENILNCLPKRLNSSQTSGAYYKMFWWYLMPGQHVVQANAGSRDLHDIVCKLRRSLGENTSARCFWRITFIWGNKTWFWLEEKVSQKSFWEYSPVCQRLFGTWDI